MKSDKLILRFLDEAYQNRTWHGPNLKQSLRGISVGFVNRNWPTFDHPIWPTPW